MGRYACGVNATGSGLTNTVAALWNPHASFSIKLRQVGFAAVGTLTLFTIRLIRTSTIGTFSTTTTPDIDNDFSRLAAPPSGTVIKSAGVTAPTQEGPPLRKTAFGAIADDPIAGCGFMWEFDPPIEIPAGTGICLAGEAGQTALPAAEVFFTWDE